MRELALGAGGLPALAGLDADAAASRMAAAAVTEAADPALSRLIESTKVLGAANLEFAVARGGAEDVGSVLLSWLEERSR